MVDTLLPAAVAFSSMSTNVLLRRKLDSQEPASSCPGKNSTKVSTFLATCSGVFSLLFLWFTYWCVLQTWVIFCCSAQGWMTYITPWLLHIKERGVSMLDLDCFMALESNRLLLSVTWYWERTYSLWNFHHWVIRNIPLIKHQVGFLIDSFKCTTRFDMSAICKVPRPHFASYNTDSDQRKAHHQCASPQQQACGDTLEIFVDRHLSEVCISTELQHVIIFHHVLELLTSGTESHQL